LEEGYCEMEMLENVLWKELHELGIDPPDIVVEGQDVRIGVTRTKEIRVPVRVLCAGISEFSRVRDLSALIRDRGLERQLDYLIWKGRRNGHR